MRWMRTLRSVTLTLLTLTLALRASNNMVSPRLNFSGSKSSSNKYCTDLWGSFWSAEDRLIHVLIILAIIGYAHHLICFLCAVSFGQYTFLGCCILFWMDQRTSTHSSYCLWRPFISASTDLLTLHSAGNFPLPHTLPGVEVHVAPSWRHVSPVLSAQLLIASLTSCQLSQNPRFSAHHSKYSVFWVSAQLSLFMWDCGCLVVSLPRNTMICTLEQLLNLGQLVVGVL